MHCFTFESTLGIKMSLATPELFKHPPESQSAQVEVLDYKILVYSGFDFESIWNSWIFLDDREI